MDAEIPGQSRGLPREIDDALPSPATPPPPPPPPSSPRLVHDVVERENAFPALLPDESFFNFRDDYEDYRGQHVEYRQLVDGGLCWNGSVSWDEGSVLMKFRVGFGRGGGIALWKV